MLVQCWESMTFGSDWWLEGDGLVGRALAAFMKLARRPAWKEVVSGSTLPK